MMVRAILLANLVTMVLGGMIEVRSALPEQTRVAVWSNTDTYGAGTKGKILADTEANTDVTQAKVDTL